MNKRISRLEVTMRDYVPWLHAPHKALRPASQKHEGHQLWWPAGTTTVVPSPRPRGQTAVPSESEQARSCRSGTLRLHSRRE